MRYFTKSAVAFFALMLSPASMILAADNQPVGRKIDNSQIMERVQLVGVIAGGSVKQPGIAVIKDAHSGKSYAIKTGDNLPGVSHITLKSVQRELAVFVADGKEFHVRLAVGGYAQDAEDEADLASDLDKTSGPGLFETWYGSKLGSGTDQESMVRGTKSVNETSPEAAEPLKNNVPKNDMIDTEAAELRKDRNGPVHDYLNQLTSGSSGKTPENKNNTLRGAGADLNTLAECDF